MESLSESSPSVAQASKEVSQIAAAIALAVAASKKPWKQAYTPHLKNCKWRNYKTFKFWRYKWRETYTKCQKKLHAIAAGMVANQTKFPFLKKWQKLISWCVPAIATLLTFVVKFMQTGRMLLLAGSQCCNSKWLIDKALSPVLLSNDSYLGATGRAVVVQRIVVRLGQASHVVLKLYRLDRPITVRAFAFRVSVGGVARDICSCKHLARPDSKSWINWVLPVS